MIKWDKIKNNYKGFENLAIDYIREREYHSHITWEATPQTRDGNKDAYAIYLGFSDGKKSEEEQWWMEAKYSNACNSLARYKLDSTIVSAILAENVSKVCFVTNSHIKYKTIRDIKTALIKNTRCKEVNFYTKYHLEYWLWKNKKYYTKYFDQPIDNVLFHESFQIDLAEFYEQSTYIISFSEPLNHLYSDKIYKMTFSLFSTTEGIYPVELSNINIDYQIVSDDYIELSQGENSIDLNFKVTNVSNPIELENIPLILNNVPILLKDIVTIIKSSDINLIVKSQQEIVKELNERFSLFTRNQRTQVNSIIGTSAIGKTYTVKEFIKLNKLNNIFMTKFNDNAFHNLQNMARIIFYILFPYVDPLEVDIDYLREIKSENYISNTLFKIAESFNSVDELNNVFSNLDKEEEIFSSSSIFNSRFLILDDFQKCDSFSEDIGIRLIDEIFKKELPIFLIIISWEAIFQNSEDVIAKSAIQISNHPLEIIWDDLVYNLNELCNFPFNISHIPFDKLFLNIPEMLEYIKYMVMVKESLTDLNDFIIATKAFSVSEHVEKSILNQFKTVFTLSEIAYEVCNIIYWSQGPVRFETNNPEINEAVYLIKKHNLLIVQNDNALSPLHDLYQLVYRKNFKEAARKLQIVDENPILLIRNQLFSTNPNDVNLGLESVRTLFDNKKFFSLFCILDQFFNDNQIKISKSLLGTRKFYELYYIYAHSLTNHSRRKSGGDIFHQIHTELENQTELDMFEFYSSSIFERINSMFEHLKFDDAYELINKLELKYNKMILLGKLDKNLYKHEKFILSCSVKMLINSELQVEETDHEFRNLDKMTNQNGFYYENAFFLLRYSETLYLSNTLKSLSLCEEAYTRLLVFGADEKFTMWAKMDIIFLTMILNDNYTEYSELEKAHESLKIDYFNDYRKRILVRVNILFIIDCISEGSELLFSDIIVARKLRPRQEGFYYSTLALYYLLNNKPDEALKYLNISRNIFKHIPSYRRLIEHNVELVKEKKFTRDHIKFASNNKLEYGYFLIDPRIIW